MKIEEQRGERSGTSLLSPLKCLQLLRTPLRYDHVQAINHRMQALREQMQPGNKDEPSTMGIIEDIAPVLPKRARKNTSIQEG